MPRRKREDGEPPLSRCGRRIVGRSPWTAAHAYVGLLLAWMAQPDQGVRRGRGRPPHEKLELFAFRR